MLRGVYKSIVPQPVSKLTITPFLVMVVSVGVTVTLMLMDDEKKRNEPLYDTSKPIHPERSPRPIESASSVEPYLSGFPGFLRI